MAATLEQFKQAFSGKVSVDPLVKRDRQAESALKELQGAVQSLDKTAPATERFQSALFDLVKRYWETKNGSGRPQDKLGQELEEIHRDTVAQIAQVQGVSQTVSAPAPPPPGSPSLSCQAGDDTDEGHLDDGKVCMAPPAKGDETRYRNNLASIQADVDKVQKAQAPDNKSRDIQSRIRDVRSIMLLAELGGDFDQANVHVDELPGLLEDYKRAVADYNKRDKAARDAQDAFETRYHELEWEIQALIDFKAPNTEASAIQNEMVREKEQIDLAVLVADFAKANTHLNQLADAMKRFRASLQKHKQDVDAKWIKEAPKRKYEANLNGIKSRMDSLTKNPPAPKDPDAPLLKKIAELKKQLQKQVSVKEPDYAAANKVVDEIRGQISQYDLKQAAKQKLKDDAAEAKAKSTYATDLKDIDYVIEFHYQMNVGGGAPWDKQAIAILDTLTKARKQYDEYDRRWLYTSYRSRQAAIDKMKALVADYKAANAAAWKERYELARSQISDKDLKWALDPAWGEGAMKKEQQKLTELFKGMEKDASSKAYYDAMVKASFLYRNLWRLKTIIFTTSGPNGAATPVRPQLLGPPFDAPTVYTLLRLLKRDGSGSIDNAEGVKLNKAGESVLDRWQGLIDRKTQWTKDIETLKKDAAKITAALQNIKQAAQAIAKGAGGPELRKTIEEYIKAEGEVVKAASHLPTGFNAYEKAAKGYMLAVTDQVRLSAERKKQAAQQKHDDEAKSLDDKKNRLRAAAGIAASILKPESWLSIPGALISIGAMELGASLFDESKLNLLKKELEIATQELQNIQDQQGVIAVEQAMAGLNEAMSAQNANRVAFQKNLEALELVGARILKEMKKTGSLSEAAKALELRGAFEGAKRSTMIYIDEAETLDGDLQQLAGRYSGFGTSFSDSAARYQEAVRVTAGGNSETLYDVSKYLKSLIPAAKTAQDYVTTAGDKANAAGFYRMLPELKKAL
jgi:hypothetical protein